MALIGTSVVVRVLFAALLVAALLGGVIGYVAATNFTARQTRATNARLAARVKLAVVQNARELLYDRARTQMPPPPPRNPSHVPATTWRVDVFKVYGVNCVNAKVPSVKIEEVVEEPNTLSLVRVPE